MIPADAPKIAFATLACGCALAACGAGAGAGGAAAGSAAGQPVVAGLISYSRSVPLDPRVVRQTEAGPLHLSFIDYTSSDGSTVPALLAVSTQTRPRGCLMYQGGIGQTLEQGQSIREGAAALGLASFTIDPRNTGQRGGVAQLERVIHSPQGIADELNNSVVDLRRGLDYLEHRSLCRHDIGYLGTSLGAHLGAILSGEDGRIRATVLTSLAASWEQTILASNQATRAHSEIPFTLLPGIESDPAALAAAVRVLSPYNDATWVARIAPRPVMLVDGVYDPLVPPAGALELAAAAQEPKSVLYFQGAHNPFAPGPEQRTVSLRIAGFLCTYLQTCPAVP